jgi:serine/threonine protein kinase
MNKIIEDYIIKEKVGSGMYGNVHRAENLKTKEKFAIKIISRETFTKVPCLERLTQNEIKALRKRHYNPHVVKFIEVMRSFHNTYYVYEYCNGGNLYDLMEKNIYLPEKLCINYFK